MNQIRKKQYYSFRLNAKDIGYWFLLVFLTLPHMKPAYLARIPSVDVIFNVLRGISFLIITFWYVVRRKSFSLMIVLVAVWRVFLVCSTFVHEGEVYNSIVESFSIMSVVVLYEATYNNGRVTFLSAQLFCFELAIYINLTTVLLFPHGMYISGSRLFTHWENWFLGYYNHYTEYCIPALMFAWLYRLNTGKGVRAYILTVAIAVTAALIWSGGVLTALGAMAVVYIFFKNRVIIFNYFSYWLLHVAWFLAVFAVRVQDILSWLIDDMLGKMVSLLFRIDLMHQTVELIRKAPVIGFGIQSSFVRAAEYHQRHGVHAHNMLLEILYQGGAIGLSLWIAIVIVAGIPVYKYRNTDESKIIATAFLGWCMATLVEPFTSPFLMGMFVIAYHSNSKLAGDRRPYRKGINRRIGRDRSFKGQNVCCSC